ncbi:MAG: aminopeptidase P family protein, partial [bacterium]
MTGAASRARVARLRAALRVAGADAFVTMAPPHVRYLSGYPLEGCAALVTGRGLWLLPAGLLAEQVRRACPWARVRPWRGGLWATLATVFKDTGVRRIAYEAGRMTVAELTQLRRAAGRPARRGGRRLIRTSEMVERLRAVKEPGELRRLRRACAIVDGAARLARRLVRPGATEKGVADRLDRFMRARGAAKSSFDLIVAAGVHAAAPHHLTGAGRLRRGQMVVVDIGCVYEGYCSDLTRTYFLGRMAPVFRRRYQMVLESQEAGIRAVRAGVTAGAVDEASRAVLRRAGLAGRFIHSTGHGVGLEIHELPRVAPGSRARL